MSKRERRVEVQDEIVAGDSHSTVVSVFGGVMKCLSESPGVRILLDRLGPCAEDEAALDVANGFRDRPAGTLRLNMPVSAARLVLLRIAPSFLAAIPISAWKSLPMRVSSTCWRRNATWASATTSGSNRT